MKPFLPLLALLLFLVGCTSAGDGVDASELASVRADLAALTLHADSLQARLDASYLREEAFAFQTQDLTEEKYRLSAALVVSRQTVVRQAHSLIHAEEGARTWYTNYRSLYQNVLQGRLPLHAQHWPMKQKHSE